MNLGKIFLGIILLALIPSHWFIGGVVASTLFGFPGVLVVAIWLLLFIGGISLIYRGLADDSHTHNPPHSQR